MRERWDCFWVNIKRGVDIMRACYVSRPEHRREGHGHTECPAWCRWVRVWIAGPAFGFEQFWFCWAWHEWGWPAWPGRVATAVHYWVDDRLKRWDRPMRWNSPDSGIPGEIGFWSPPGATRERSQTRVFIHDGDAAMRGTGGSGTSVTIHWCGTAPEQEAA